jgi:hypothetical protein
LQSKQLNILMEADSINLVDKSKKMYVRIKLSEDRKYWERWVSSDKRSWELSSKLKSLTQVLESQQELIDSNYKNLFNVILKKERVFVNLFVSFVPKTL